MQIPHHTCKASTVLYGRSELAFERCLWICSIWDFLRLFFADKKGTSEPDMEVSESGKPAVKEMNVSEVKELIAKEFNAEVAEKFEGEYM